MLFILRLILLGTSSGHAALLHKVYFLQVSGKVSKPRDLYLEKYTRSEIWQAQR